MHCLNDIAAIQGGKVAGMECLRMELGAPDVSGRRRPISIEGSKFVMNADMVISAIGEISDLTFLPKKHKFNVIGSRALEVDPVSLGTSMSGVFAGGDIVSGPATVVEAIAAGRKAATSIECYLSGKSLPPEKDLPPTMRFEEMTGLGAREGERESRVVMPTLPLEDRVPGFKEINLGLSQELAMEEAERCLHCAARFWPISGRMTKEAQ